MRLVTWNCCRGPLEKKAALLESLSPDIAVLQECARPASESESCLWFGHNPRQGIAVVAREPYRLRRIEPRPRVPRYIVPIAVTGPVAFTILAVWSKGGQAYSYVEAVIRAARMYRPLIETSPTVLLGDLNSNVFWDSEHKPGWNHSALVALLAKMNLVSAYHEFRREDHGRETKPTYYFLWKEDRPYHLDYCFLPREWMQRVCRVEIGSYEDWKSHSDHRPLLVDIADGA